MLALVDVNSFYAACETLFRPDLRGKPVVVVSNNDGCVIARSAEAKMSGVPMGEPLFKLKQSDIASQVHIFSSNYALYADLSARVMATLADMSAAVEIYSIDEAFVTLPIHKSTSTFHAQGVRIRNRIKQYTGLTVGVGIAPTKTLAKLANYMAKNQIMSNGIVELASRAQQREVMAQVGVDHVWGVGQRLSSRLHQLGIHTALQLAESSTTLLRKKFSVVVERIARELRGEACLALESAPQAKQQIICSRSFGCRIEHYDELHQAVCTYAERAAQKLRQANQCCRTVSVFIRTSPYAVSGEYYANQASGQLLTPSADTRAIIRIATQALQCIWVAGHHYIKAGIMLSDFSPKGVVQADLFAVDSASATSDALMQVIDKIHQEGKGKVWFAGQGVQKRWAMKREMLSPAYTTRYSDLPIVK